MSECRCLTFEGEFYSACWCKDCEHIKLRCGCALLPFKTKQIESFLCFLKELQERKITHEAKASVQFKFADISFVFSAAELADLINILERIQLEVQRENLERVFTVASKEHIGHF